LSERALESRSALREKLAHDFQELAGQAAAFVHEGRRLIFVALRESYAADDHPAVASRSAAVDRPAQGRGHNRGTAPEDEWR